MRARRRSSCPVPCVARRNPRQAWRPGRLAPGHQLTLLNPVQCPLHCTPCSLDRPCLLLMLRPPLASCCTHLEHHVTTEICGPGKPLARLTHSCSQALGALGFHRRNEQGARKDTAGRRGTVEQQEQNHQMSEHDGGTLDFFRGMKRQQGGAGAGWIRGIMPPAVGVQAVEGAYLDEQAFVGARERGVWRGWQGGFNAAFLPRTLQTCILMEKTGGEEQCNGAGRRDGRPACAHCSRHSRTNILVVHKQAGAMLRVREQSNAEVGGQVMGQGVRWCRSLPRRRCGCVCATPPSPHGGQTSAAVSVGERRARQLVLHGRHAALLSGCGAHRLNSGVVRLLQRASRVHLALAAAAVAAHHVQRPARAEQGRCPTAGVGDQAAAGGSAGEQGAAVQPRVAGAARHVLRRARPAQAQAGRQVQRGGANQAGHERQQARQHDAAAPCCTHRGYCCCECCECCGCAKGVPP